jgi:hypothetical protein
MSCLRPNTTRQDQVTKKGLVFFLLMTNPVTAALILAKGCSCSSTVGWAVLERYDSTRMFVLHHL